jgi:hypothetical protein
VGQTAPNGAANQETRPFRALFPNNIQFLDPWISPLKLMPLDWRIRSRKAVGARQPTAERLILRLMDLKFVTSTGLTK